MLTLCIIMAFSTTDSLTTTYANGHKLSPALTGFISRTTSIAKTHIKPYKKAL
ncbi:hypothetical protein D3C87_319000 [compost metagenome]